MDLILANLSEIARFSRETGIGSFPLIAITLVGMAFSLGVIFLLIDRIFTKAEEEPVKTRKTTLELVQDSLSLSGHDVEVIEVFAERIKLPAVEFLLIDPTLWVHGISENPHLASDAREVMLKLFGEQIVDELMSETVTVA